MSDPFDLLTTLVTWEKREDFDLLDWLRARLREEEGNVWRVFAKQVKSGELDPVKGRELRDRVLDEITVARRQLEAEVERLHRQNSFMRQLATTRYAKREGYREEWRG